MKCPDHALRRLAETSLSVFIDQSPPCLQGGYQHTLSHSWGHIFVGAGVWAKLCKLNKAVALPLEEGEGGVAVELLRPGLMIADLE